MRSHAQILNPLARGYSIWLGDAPVRYLVGTPKGRLTRLEKSFLGLPWQEVRQSVDVKLLTRDAELYVLVRSERRVLKERSMRRRRLNKLWKRLGELHRQSNRRDQLMLKLGAAKKEAGRAWFLVEVQVPRTDKELAAQGFTYRLRREKLRQVFRREGRYLLRSNMTSEDPAALWRHYMQLTEIEQAFKELKHNLAIRPIFQSAIVRPLDSCPVRRDAAMRALAPAPAAMSIAIRSCLIGWRRRRLSAVPIAFASPDFGARRSGRGWVFRVERLALCCGAGGRSWIRSIRAEGGGSRLGVGPEGS